MCPLGGVRPEPQADRRVTTLAASSAPGYVAALALGAEDKFTGGSRIGVIHGRQPDSGLLFLATLKPSAPLPASGVLQGVTAGGLDSAIT